MSITNPISFSKRRCCGVKRRDVMRRLLAALGLAAATPAHASSPNCQPSCPQGSDPNCQPSCPLARGDRIDLAGGESAILEMAYRLGYEYEQRYGGCAQCTVAALQDALPFLPRDVGLFRGASCVDGGATPNGLQSCGSFTGAGMVLGYLCGRTRDEIFWGDKALAHELIREVYQRFEEYYGSVLCKDVRAWANADCPTVVANAAKWTAEALLKVFADYRPPQPPESSPNPPPEGEPKQP